jgi:SSS family solute:Na+ symporter
VSAKLTWLVIFLVLYWGYCIFWGARCGLRAPTARDYFLAGRRLPAWLFIMGVTTAAFGGWSVVGHPGLVFRDGFPYVFAAIGAIAVPLTGVVLLKRQWALSKRFGYVTPGEMLAHYYGSEALRLIVSAIALLFAIPFVGLLLGGSGFLISVVSDGGVSRDVAMWGLAVVLVIYVTAGGIAGIANVAVLQGILAAMGMIILGLIALDHVGGFETLNRALADLAATRIGEWGTTRGLGGGDYNGLFALPGVAQWTAGLGKEVPVGGLWTGVMCLSFLFALLGVLAAPTFSIWAFSSETPRPFAAQQVWASAAAVGLIIVAFSAIQGVSALVLGADKAVTEAGLAVAQVLAELPDGQQAALVPYYINSVSAALPWLAALLAVCAVVAMQATGAAHMAASGTLLSRDVFRRFLTPSATHRGQKLFARLAILIVTALSLLLATFDQDTLVELAALALPVAFQLWPPLLGVAWFPWITRQGALYGLGAGIIAVILTESFGQTLTGGTLPWGRWPWTIHSAGWGIAVNLAICIIGSAMSQNHATRAHRQRFHDFLRAHVAVPSGRGRIKTFAWMLVVVWLFFGAGPGAVVGNYLFGAPDAGYDGWDFAMPSLWAWRILWWGLGVVLIWFLAYRMELSTAPAKPIASLSEDHHVDAGAASSTLRHPHRQSA